MRAFGLARGTDAQIGQSCCHEDARTARLVNAFRGCGYDSGEERRSRSGVIVTQTSRPLGHNLSHVHLHIYLNMSNTFLKRVCMAMERIAPLRLAEKWDNVRFTDMSITRD